MSGTGTSTGTVTGTTGPGPGADGRPAAPSDRAVGSEAPSVVRAAPAALDAEADVVVVGAGACGLVAALRAAAFGADVLVLERDATPSGSTSMSSGFVPAPATRFQRAAGTDDDTPARLVADIMGKSGGRAVGSIAHLAAARVGPALEWLADAHDLEWLVLDGFLYPGHSRHRMHAVPERSGGALHARLLAAAGRAGIPIVSDARVSTLHVDVGRRVTAVRAVRPDGATETLGCGALVLACSGFGGNPERVRRHIPAIADGIYHGHAGNTGDALAWGEALGARTAHLGAWQGHGSLAHPHAILITWALMVEGGVQVDAHGQRFSDESGGYSEQAVNVAARPGGIVHDVYDARLHAFAQTFPDYREAMAAGAVIEAPTLAALAERIGVPPASLRETIDAVEACRAGRATDAFGRDFGALPAFAGAWYAVKVAGALFHTQGGLMIDEDARVLGDDGRALPNLHAAGGAACGVSGPDVTGYLSGNGLLTAIGLGFVAGEAAARVPPSLVARRRPG